MGGAERRVGSEPAAPPAASPKLRACARCGTFAKRTMALGTRVCTECAERLSPTLRQRSVGSLWSGALRALWATPFITALAIAGGVMVVLVDLAVPSRPLVYALEVAVSLALYPFLYPLVAHATWDFVHGRRRSTRDAILDAARAYRRIVGPSALLTASVLMYTVLFVLPGVLRLVTTAFVVPIVLFEDRPTATAFEESVRRTEGSRGALLLCFVPSFVPGLVLSVLSGVVGSAHERIELGLGLVAAATGPLTTAAITLVYLRDRLARRI